MSYPGPRYHGAQGEISAELRPHDTPDDLVYPNGTRAAYLSTGDGTDGLFGLYRWSMPPGSGGPALHFHRTISESFFVLSGSVRLLDGEREVTATSGDYLHVPPGGLHGFGNHSDEPASMLILFAPGAPREGYFEGLAEVAGGRQLSPEERSAFLAAHDTFFASGS